MRIFLSKPHMSGTELDHVKDAFASGFMAPVGPHIDDFEATVAQYLGGGVHCVAVSSGTAALHLALRILGVRGGDHVIVSSMTFAGGVFPIVYQGAKPVFADLDPRTWTLDVGHVRDALERMTRANRRVSAIVPTDLYGQSVDIHGFQDLAKTYGVPLIVDSAESFGSRGPGGARCGTGGDASILSFNGNKIITTSGGGMLVTGTASIAAEARHLASQAREQAAHYEHVQIGYNYRLSNVCAAIGLGQLEVLDDRVDARRRVFARYEEALSQHGVTFMPEPVGYRSSRWLTVAYFDPDVTGTTREKVREALVAESIESRPLWKPMHLQPVFQPSEYYGEGFDELLFRHGLCLPSGSDLTVEEQNEIISIIAGLIGTG